MSRIRNFKIDEIKVQQLQNYIDTELLVPVKQL